MSSVFSHLHTLLLNDGDMLCWHKNDYKAGLFTLLVAKTRSFQLRVKDVHYKRTNNSHMLKVLKLGAW